MKNKGAIIAPGTVRFERRFNAPVYEMWSWLTESEKRGKWLAKGEMELFEGGMVNLQFLHSELSPLPGGPPEKYKAMESGHAFTGKMLKIDPPHLLSFTWDGGSEVTFELKASGKDTLLTITHRLLPTDKDARSSVLGGWHTHLDILAARLRGEIPPNFWALHTALESDYAASPS
jgi:uncharacterized protein YndB with AHSA1/START domain